jgi:hypothetical protein
MPCPGEWRNWQTRRLQVPVGLRSWGFKSPLAHAVFPTDIPRRRGRRRIYVVLSIITVIALLMLAVSRQRNDTRDSIAYLVEADSTVNTYQDLAREFQAQILGDLRTVNREDVEALVAQYVADARQKSNALAEMTVSSSVAPAAAALDLAISSWNAGLESFAPGLLGIVDHPTSDATVEALAGSLAQLRAGDAAYKAFMGAVDELRTEMDLPVDFPEVAFLPSGPLGYLYGITDAVAGAAGLELRRDLEVSAIKLDPKEVKDDNGDLILPATDSIVVEASVRNSGNQPESDLVVSVTLQDSAGAVVGQFTDRVNTLDPRASTTVDFDPLSVATGRTYTMTVSVAVLPNEVDVENNVKQISIRINEPS